jgi:hypothetical protein
MFGSYPESGGVVGCRAGRGKVIVTFATAGGAVPVVGV